MPELPEVETVVRGLRPAVTSARIQAVWSSGLPLRLARPLDHQGLASLAVGAHIAAVERRGKFILLRLARGQRAAGAIAVHLGMTGRLHVQPTSNIRPPHTHVGLALAGQRELRFVDPRRFGAVSMAAGDRLPTEVEALGPDPLTELDVAGLRDRLLSSRASLKAVLLDQTRIAGLGNIYVCEAMFRAGLHPALPAHKAGRRAEPLLAAIRASLELGIANRGTSLRDYVDADGMPGANQNALLVYGRAGLPCRSCAAPIRRRVDGGRSTFFCARCQRR